MSDCDHTTTGVTAEVYRIPDQGTVMWTVGIAVFCRLCGVRFRFLGDMALMPDSPQDAMLRRIGAWVSGAGDEMGCVIAPIEPGDALQTIEVQGRA